MVRLNAPKAEGRLSCPSRHRCPITQIRTLDHVTALREIGRHGDFGRIDGLRKQYKRSARSPPSRCHPLPQALALLARHISLAGAFAIPSHRRAHLIKMNLASDPQVRSRSNWGTLLKARRIDPSVADDLAAELEENSKLLNGSIFRSKV